MSIADLTTSIRFETIPECPGYRFGDDGSIWSCWGQGATEPNRAWRRLSPTLRRSGHSSLWVKVAGKATPVYSHVMTAWAFHGRCPAGMECRHLDGNPSNNIPSNLRWGTRAENIADQRRHGVYIKGERAGLAKLTEDQVREIRRLRETENRTFRDLGSMFGVAHCTIKAIIHRMTWTHL